MDDVRMLKLGEALQRIYWRLPYEARRTAYRYLRPESYRRMASLRTRAPVSALDLTIRSFIESKCLFVHVPKCAGVSVCQGLFGHDAGGHLSVVDYRIIFSRVEFEEFFKFTFVRNPWDRTLSAYRYLMKGGRVAEDAARAADSVQRFATFDDFVRGWLDEANANASLHFRPQTSFLCTPFGSRLLVDFVGRFERLDADFAFVAARLGREGRLLHLNRSASADSRSGSRYRDAYSREAREVVARVYAKDIELLGYEF